jgi:N-acetyl-anhydromuramyl-L-alanine amidase AmpD
MKHIVIFNIILFISFSHSLIAGDSLAIIDKRVNFGYAVSQNRKVDAVIVHSTFNNSGGDFYDIDLVLKQFSTYKVSAHYVIGRDGIVYRVVDEQNVSYHAGKSNLPDGRTDVNSCSIGIEIMTSYKESPTDKQVTSLIALINSIKKRHSINYVLRHSDIAPVRKTDPWNMDWEQFQQQLAESK